MELTIKVDRQGRTVLPREVRIALGIDGETEMVCRVVGSRLVLEKFDVDSVRKAFSELEEIVPSLELDTVKVEGEDKY
ncbi:MAG: AbrB/MazE/SpoVT family DNA-binding domain-containing protein, partial [Nitrososphaeria archaeon]